MNAMTSLTMPQRFRAAMATAGISPKLMREKLGIRNKATLSATCTRGGPLERVQQIAQITGHREEWLLTGSGPPTVGTQDSGYASAPIDAGRSIKPAGTARGGTADTESQIAQREVAMPNGTQYLAVEGHSGGDVFWQGQLAILAPPQHQPKQGDIAAVSFPIGKHVGQTVIKRIGPKVSGFVQLDSLAPDFSPLMVPEADWLAAEKRLVMGVIYRPELLK